MAEASERRPNDNTFVSQAGLNGRTTDQPQGKVLGGSSAINGSAFVAPSRAGIDAWAELGNPDWTYDSLLAYFRKAYSIQSPDAHVCKEMGVDHMGNINNSAIAGPIRLSYPALEQKHMIAKAWNDAMRILGYETTADPFPLQSSGSRCYTAAIHPETGKRSFSAREYGETAFKRDNVSLVAEATVTRILLDPLEPGPLTATGVEVSFNGKTHSVAARKEVIVSAGTFHTPKLLELSGIGARSLLESLEIPVVIESPGVGQNLHNHLMSLVSFELNEGIAIGEGGQAISLLALPDHQQQQDLFDEHEPVEPESKVSYETVRKIFADKTEASASFFLTFMGMPNFASLGLMQTLPVSRGSCHIHSKDATQSPRIDPNFFSNPLDLEIMARHFLTFTSLPSNEALQPFFKQDGQSLPPISHVTDVEHAKEFLRQNALTTYHSVGSAAMLPKEKGGVVDQKLLVHGTRNLRIVDASVIPLIPQANPMSSVYAIAERAADIIQAGMKN